MVLTDYEYDTDSDDEECVWRREFNRTQQQVNQQSAAASGRRPGKKRYAKEVGGRDRRNAEKFAKGDERSRRLDPMTSPWWKLAHDPEVRNQGSKAAKKFRLKFRCPIEIVDEIMVQAKLVPEFADKPQGGGHGRGPSRHPLIIKVLAALRHLAKGDDYDSLEDAAQISASTLRAFTLKFLQWFKTTIYPVQVTKPTGAHLSNSMAAYTRLGFPGAYCEIDGVHIHWYNCKESLHARFSGKEGYPTLAFNVSALHTREIIHVSNWCAGSVNDKTQAAHDELMRDLHQGKISPDLTYYLYNSRDELVGHRGLYAIVDGGYFEWRCLQAPLKHQVDFNAARWSERIESVRKAIENTFGVMKQRFRLLTLPILETEPHAPHRRRVPLQGNNPLAGAAAGAPGVAGAGSRHPSATTPPPPTTPSATIYSRCSVRVRDGAF